MASATGKGGGGEVGGAALNFLMCGSLARPLDFRAARHTRGSPLLCIIVIIIIFYRRRSSLLGNAAAKLGTGARPSLLRSGRHHLLLPPTSIKNGAEESAAVHHDKARAQCVCFLEEGRQHDPALRVLGAAVLAVEQLLQAPVLALRPDRHLVGAGRREEEAGERLDRCDVIVMEGGC